MKAVAHAITRLHRPCLPFLGAGPGLAALASSLRIVVTLSAVVIAGSWNWGVASARAAAEAERNAPASGQEVAKEIAQHTSWTWSDDQTGPLYSLGQCKSRYDVAIIGVHSDSPILLLTFKVLDGDRVVYAWKGHKHSVFQLVDDRLYYVESSLYGPGATFVAVDVKSGKELVRSPFEGIGKPPHSIYSNRVSIQNIDSNTIAVFGMETSGCYYEIKDLKTGKTIGHKTFPPPPPTVDR